MITSMLYVVALALFASPLYIMNKNVIIGISRKIMDVPFVIAILLTLASDILYFYCVYKMFN